MEEKNNIWGYILVAVVTIIIGVAIGFGVSYLIKEDKEPDVSVQDDNNWAENDENEDNVEENEEKVYSDWTAYLLDQEIKEMYIAIWGEDENQQPYSRNINITKEELSNIFTEMKKGDLTKHYISGGGDTTPDLVIKYNSDGQSYELRIKQGREIWNTDLDIKTSELLEKENYKVEGQQDNTNSYVVYQYDWDAETYLKKIIEEN